MLCVLEVDCSNQVQAAETICKLIDLAVEDAQKQLRSNRIPSIYSSGVRFILQPPQACAFRLPLDVFKRKQGDCKQLVVWRLAELRNQGENAKPRIIWPSEIDGKKTEGLQAHAQIRRANNSIEDPSIHLGMKGLLSTES